MRKSKYDQSSLPVQDSKSIDSDDNISKIENRVDFETELVNLTNQIKDIKDVIQELKQIKAFVDASVLTFEESAQIDLGKIAAVVYKPAYLFAVYLEKVLFRHIEGLGNAFSYRNARHDNDKLAPPVSAVEFKHSAYIDVSFARACLHFNIQTAPAEMSDKT